MRMAVLATVLFVGCFDPSYDDGRVRCAHPNLQCPDGYHCIADHCFRNDETPDLAGVLSFVQLAGPAKVHLPHAVAVEADLWNLVAVDRGTVTFSSTAGTLDPPTCTRLSVDTARCATTLTVTSPGKVTVVATNDDDGATGAMVIEVGAPVVVSLPAQADVLAFGDSPPALVVPAAVRNLFDGESMNVGWSVVSGTSVQVSGGGSVRATPLPFPATAPPLDSVVRATSVADPTAFAEMTVHAHAWVDESAAVAALFPPTLPPQLWTVAVSSTGGVLVGGRTLGGSHRPVAAVRNAAGTWSVALDGFNAAEGAITGSTAGPDGRFLIGGVTGMPDGNGNRPLLVLHCSAGNAACTLASNVAPPGYAGYSPATVDGTYDDFAGGSVLPPIANPAVRVCGPAFCQGNTYKNVLFNVRGMGCASGTNVMGTMAYDQIDDPPAGLGFINFVDDSMTPYPDNTCPFSTKNGGRVLLGMAANDGEAQVWFSGYAECTPSGCGSTNPTAGLFSFQDAIANTSHTYQPQLVAADLLGPAIRTGYDGSLIAIGTLADPGNPGISLLWFDNVLLPSPGGFLHISAPSGTNDVGLVANGGTTGAPWSSSIDLWWSFTRKAADGSRSLGLGWMGTQGARSQTTTRPSASDGYQVLDLIFRGSASGVEGWAVGHRLTSSGPVAPLVAHLR